MAEMLTAPTVGRQRRRDKIRAVILQALFRSLYGPGARIYDRFTRVVFAGEWRRWQLSALEHVLPGGVVVELGCGTGDLAGSVSDRFGTWIGLDISLEMIRTARQQQSLTAHFVRADASAIPLREGSADTVLTTFPTNYIYEPAVMSEARRVLKSDGRLVVVMTGELNPGGIRRRIVHVLTRALEGDGEVEAALLPGFEGFNGEFAWTPTAFGRALVYVGRPVLEPSQQNGRRGDPPLRRASRVVSADTNGNAD